MPRYALLRRRSVLRSLFKCPVLLELGRHRRPYLGEMFVPGTRGLVRLRSNLQVINEENDYYFI